MTSLTEFPHVQGAIAVSVAGLIYILAKRIITGTWE